MSQQLVAAGKWALLGGGLYLSLNAIVNIIKNLPMLKIPGPKGKYFVSGMMFAIRDAPPMVLQCQWEKLYGSMVCYRIVGFKFRLIISDPEAMKKILVTSPYLYKKPDIESRILKVLAGDGLVMAEGDNHQRQRRVIGQAFHFQNLKRVFPTFVEMGDRLVHALKTQMDAEGKVDVIEFMNLCTLDIIGRTAFGYDFKAMDMQENNVRKAIDMLFGGLGLSWRFMFIQMFPTLSSYLFIDERAKAERLLFQTVEKLISEKKAGKPSTTPDLLDLMMEANDSESSQFTTQELIDNVKTFIFAGHETSSTSLAWAFYALSKHTDVRDKLRAELRDVLKGEKLQYDDLDRLPYLNAVVRETLRMYPPVGLLFRETCTDDNLCGYAVPKGTSLILSPMVMHKSEKYWTRPDEFLPERFVPGHKDEDKTSSHPFRWFPFLAGARMCIGWKFAMQEISAVLACVIQKYDLDVVEGHEELKPRMRVTMKPHTHLHMTIKPAGIKSAIV